MSRHRWVSRTRMEDDVGALDLHLAEQSTFLLVEQFWDKHTQRSQKTYHRKMQLLDIYEGGLKVKATCKEGRNTRIDHAINTT
jgi:hypothetical protein